MNFDTLTSMIQHFGYAALFFSLWLGIVGMPLPDEVIVMTGGAVTVSGTLEFLSTFLLTYSGVISGLSLGYVLGGLVGTPVLDKLARKNQMDKYIALSEKLVRKYGSKARHAYLVGINKMSFKQYAMISYSTGLVWTLLFFMAGRFVRNHVQDVGYLVHNYGLKLLCLTIVWFVLVMAIRLFRMKQPTEGDRD